MERARSLYHDTARMLLSRCLHRDAAVDTPVRGIWYAPSLSVSVSVRTDVDSASLYLVSVCYLQTAELSYAIGKLAAQELESRLSSVHQKLSTVNPVLTLCASAARGDWRRVRC
jgi:hypothetical protein